MKLKNVLTNYFEHSDLLISGKTDFEELEKRILTKVTPKQRRRFFPITLVSFFALLLVILGGFLYIKPHIAPVSAQEIIEKTTQVLKETERIHYKIYYGGKAYEKPLTPEESARVGLQEIKPENKTYEFWYDFKNSITRVEIPEYSDVLSGKTVLIEKKLDNRDSALLYTYSANENSKEGLFQDYQGTRAYAYQQTGAFQLNTPENPRKKFEELLTDFKDNKGTKLETVSENGKDYYQLTLHLSYDENSSNIQVTSYKALIEKGTYRPYKEIVSYDNGKGTIELTYQEVDSDFDGLIFGPVPPKGYTIATNPKMKFSDRFAKAGPIVLLACGITPMTGIDNHDICSEGITGIYAPDIEIFTDKGHVMSPGYAPLVGLNFKLYKSKQTFTTEDEAKNAANIDYVEVISANGELLFPETEKIVNGAFRKFKLEMFDSKSGEKIDEIETIQEMVATEAKG